MGMLFLLRNLFWLCMCRLLVILMWFIYLGSVFGCF